MGHKENIIELLREHKLGLTYNDLLAKYEVKFKITLYGKEKIVKGKNENKKNGYYYLRGLKNKGLVKTYIPEDREGKIIAYKLTEKGLTGEPNDSEKPIDTSIIKKMIPEFIKHGLNLETTTEKEDKRLMELIGECQ